jgi:hypothetical protein
VRGVVALLVVASACGRADGPYSAETRIEVRERLVSDIAQRHPNDRWITVRGDGAVEVDDSQGTHAGQVSRTEVRQLLNELVSIDFLTLTCDGMRTDHGFHVSLSLVANGTSNHVRVESCAGTSLATIETVVDQLEKVADRVTTRR